MVQNRAATATAVLDEIRRREIERQAGKWSAERDRCRRDVLYWFDRWVWTYDPRLTGTPSGPFIRMVLWPKQREAVLWLMARLKAREEGLLEKSRDVGATYLCGGVAVHQWLFEDGFKATFGSRVEDLVDDKDNPDSIFAKIRIIVRRQPPELMPAGFRWTQHDNYMRLSNPETGAIITGEGGQEMGRGGRSSAYFLDEAAFVPQAGKVEAAVSGNTDCMIWVSSANGLGNVFARKRHTILPALGADRIARIHWRDDPRKTEAWAAAKKASLSDPTTWASEYEIDYSASVEGICIPAKWVEAARRVAKLDPRVVAYGRPVLGGDVGAGKAKSIAIVRAGSVVRRPLARKDGDTTQTAVWMRDIAKGAKCARLNFDNVGVGAGVQSTLLNQPPDGLQICPINVGLRPTFLVWPDDLQSIQKFANWKAEIWWLARTWFERTYFHVLALEGDPNGVRQDPAQVLALPSGDPDSDMLAFQLSLVKVGKNEKGLLEIEKKEALRKRGIPSPDYAEAFVLTFAEPTIFDDGLAGPEVISADSTWTRRESDRPF